MRELRLRKFETEKKRPVAARYACNKKIIGSESAMDWLYRLYVVPSQIVLVTAVVALSQITDPVV